MKLMALLDQQGALSASEAEELIGLSRYWIGRQGHDLVARGWARELRDPDDKRIIRFDLTRAGKHALDNGGSHDPRRQAMAG
jgi:DNA-binding MarR family transcriptional regulator